MNQENFQKIKSELESGCLANSEFGSSVHSCYVSSLNLIKEYNSGNFSLKKNETLEDKCFLVLLTEIPSWKGTNPINEYKGYGVFYKVLKLKDVTQLS